MVEDDAGHGFSSPDDSAGGAARRKPIRRCSIGAGDDPGCTSLDVVAVGNADRLIAARVEAFYRERPDVADRPGAYGV
jgi:hypothetical protein